MSTEASRDQTRPPALLCDVLNALKVLGKNFLEHGSGGFHAEL
jgi:hypothetical protein